MIFFLHLTVDFIQILLQYKMHFVVNLTSI